MTEALALMEAFLKTTNNLAFHIWWHNRLPFGVFDNRPIYRDIGSAEWPAYRFWETGGMVYQASYIEKILEERR